MIDIHCHILPEVDDGADSYEEALSMAREAVEAGTRIMVATPHYFNSSQCRFQAERSDIIARYIKLRDYIASAGCPLTLCLGSEQFGVTDIGRLASENKLIPLNSSHYLLVEFDFEDDPGRVRYVLSQIFKAGYKPVVAHPERYAFVQENPRFVYSLLDMGCILQINKGSPLGRYGREERELALWMLRERLPHMVASDCHSPFQRTPDMSELHRELSIHVSENYAELLFEENPRHILMDEEPEYY